MICFCTRVKVEELAKQYTKEQLTANAITEFKAVLTDPNLSFNTKSFPSNESDGNAFIKCHDEKTAQMYCPERWKAMQAWIANTVKVSGLETFDLHNLVKHKGGGGGGGERDRAAPYKCF